MFCCGTLSLWPRLAGLRVICVCVFVCARTLCLQIEEGHAIGQLAHVWHCVVRHHSLFHSFYPQFVNQIVASLPKLALTPAATLEHRLLALGECCRCGHGVGFPALCNVSCVVVPTCV